MLTIYGFIRQALAPVSPKVKNMSKKCVKKILVHTHKRKSDSKKSTNQKTTKQSLGLNVYWFNNPNQLCTNLEEVQKIV
jgi:hypothetical protein